MAFRARILNRDLAVLSATGNFAQNEVGNFTLSIPRQDILGLGDLFRRGVTLYWNGTPLFTGLVYGKIEYQLNPDDCVVAQIPCTDELGRLLCLRSFQGTGHFQNTPLVAILNQLLDLTTADWELGDTSTILDPVVATTIDLRSKQTRFAQLAEAVKSVPGLFMRYGGISAITGRHRLDIGHFGRNSGLRLVQSSNLLSVTARENDFERVNVIEAYGGKAGSTVITLEHALQYDPTLVIHPQYPIVLDALSGTYIVQNLALTGGCESTLDFQLHKTENMDGDEPSAAEIAQAGYALWQKAVRYFEENQRSTHYTAQIVSDTVPPLNDNGWLSSVVKEEFYNILTARVETRETFAVQDWIRIVRTAFTVNDQDCLEWTVELDTNEYWATEDTELQLYDKLERSDAKDRPLDPLGGQPVLLTIPTSLQHVGVASDCIHQPSGLPGKLFAVPMPSVPAGATSVFAVTSVSPVNAQVQVTQNPALPATGFGACVTIGAGWTLASDVTLSVFFMFTT